MECTKRPCWVSCWKSRCVTRDQMRMSSPRTSDAPSLGCTRYSAKSAQRHVQCLEPSAQCHVSHQPELTDRKHCKRTLTMSTLNVLCWCQTIYREALLVRQEGGVKAYDKNCNRSHSHPRLTIHGLLFHHPRHPSETVLSPLPATHSFLPDTFFTVSQHACRIRILQLALHQIPTQSTPTSIYFL